MLAMRLAAGAIGCLLLRVLAQTRRVCYGKAKAACRGRLFCVMHKNEDSGYVHKRAASTRARTCKVGES